MTIVPLLMSATVVWNVYGLADGFFRRTWQGAPIPVTFIAYLVNMSWVALLGLGYGLGNAFSPLAAILGGVMFIWSAVGTALLLKNKTSIRFVPWLPGYVGPGVAALMGLLVIALSIRA